MTSTRVPLVLYVTRARFPEWDGSVGAVLAGPFGRGRRRGGGGGDVGRLLGNGLGRQQVVLGFDRPVGPGDHRGPARYHHHGPADDDDHGPAHHDHHDRTTAAGLGPGQHGGGQDRHRRTDGDRAGGGPGHRVPHPSRPGLVPAPRRQLGPPRR